MIDNLLKAATGTVLLPVTVAVDIVCIPLIANDDMPATTPIMIKCIAENVMDAVAPDNKRIAP